MLYYSLCDMPHSVLPQCIVRHTTIINNKHRYIAKEVDDQVDMHME